MMTHGVDRVFVSDSFFGNRFVLKQNVRINEDLGLDRKLFGWS